MNNNVSCPFFCHGRHFRNDVPFSPANLCLVQMSREAVSSGWGRVCTGGSPATCCLSNLVVLPIRAELPSNANFSVITASHYANLRRLGLGTLLQGRTLVARDTTLLQGRDQGHNPAPGTGSGTHAPNIIYNTALNALVHLKVNSY